VSQECPTLEIRGISAAYGHKNVLNEVSARVGASEVLAVIGPNGCGKSTLLRCVSGLLLPRSGEIHWDGAPLPRDPRERARRVALSPQGYSGGGDMTLEAMTLLGRTPHLGPYGAAGRADESAVEDAIALIAPDLRGRRLDQMSGGERQRALLCRAVATAAPVLLLDEPVAALDIRHQFEILALVKTLARERHLAVVCVLHQINLAAAVADSMSLLSTGRVAAAGSPEEVMTEANLTEIYGTPLRVVPHPVSGRPQAQSLFSF